MDTKWEPQFRLALLFSFSWINCSIWLAFSANWLKEVYSAFSDLPSESLDKIGSRLNDLLPEIRQICHSDLRLGPIKSIMEATLHVIPTLHGVGAKDEYQTNVITGSSAVAFPADYQLEPAGRRSELEASIMYLVEHDFEGCRRSAGHYQHVGYIPIVVVGHIHQSQQPEFLEQPMELEDKMEQCSMSALLGHQSFLESLCFLNGMDWVPAVTAGMVSRCRQRHQIA
ncbi:hypothetical protein K7X08_020815 [Anisodus acutangulus]|uniref:Uncharacterized protein n=1 Tax=Anisodus acutangulus TaxID=402998 RepID=A0A9Q1RMS9_9SOLA|nr:hypothetical protein K7X08_020815 [Anisodus acutangulus]